MLLLVSLRGEKSMEEGKQPQPLIVEAGAVSKPVLRMSTNRYRVDRPEVRFISSMTVASSSIHGTGSSPLPFDSLPVASSAKESSNTRKRFVASMRTQISPTKIVQTYMNSI